LSLATYYTVHIYQCTSNTEKHRSNSSTEQRKTTTQFYVARKSHILVLLTVYVVHR